MSEDAFYKLAEDCPHNIRTHPVDWLEWCQREGYARRMHGNLLNKALVDYLVSHPHVEGRLQPDEKEQSNDPSN